MVEPMDPLECRELHRIQASPPRPHGRRSGARGPGWRNDRFGSWWSIPPGCHVSARGGPGSMSAILGWVRDGGTHGFADVEVAARAKRPAPSSIAQVGIRAAPVHASLRGSVWRHIHRADARPLAMVFFIDPGAIRQIFTGDADWFRSGRAFAVFEPFFGPNSLLLLDGARHRRERRLLMPPFHGKRMRLYGEMMCEIADRSIDAWPVDTSFPVYARLQDITLEVMLRVVFGVADQSRLFRLRAALVEALGLWDVRNPLRPIKAWWRFGRIRREIDELLHDEVRRRRAARPEERTDIMSMLVTARDEDGLPMSDEEVRDEMFTMLVAGHETTATSLAWVIHRLVEHPDVLAGCPRGGSVGRRERTLPAPAYCRADCSARLPGCGNQGDGAPPPGRAHRRAPARDGPYLRLRGAAGRLYCRAMHLPRSPPTRPVARAEFVRPPPVRGEAHGPLYVLPVRRRGAPLPGRSVRDLRDEDRVGPRVVTHDPAAGSRLCRSRRAAWSGAGPFLRLAGDTHGGLTGAGTFTGPCRPRTGASTDASAYCWKPTPPREQHTRVDAVALRHHRD